MKKILASTCSILMFYINLFAQQTTDVEMADAMRANGKIYVVIIVLLVIFAGVITYLILLDRKISKLEKNKN